MMKALLRIIGYMFLGFTFIIFILDALAILATGEVDFVIFGKTWTDIAPATLNQTQFALQEHLGLVWFWDNIMQKILLQPTVLVFFILGLLFCLLGRRSKKREGFHLR